MKEIKLHSIITPKKEWLDTGEEYGTPYLVIEDRGDNILYTNVEPREIGYFKHLQWCGSKEWFDVLDGE